ncbi:MAG: chromophore lyase CpcT/CpeT [Vicinamibacterales bacterium]
MRARALTMAACLMMLTTAAPQAAAQAAAPPGKAAGDLAVLERWLSGEFDNFQQAYEARETRAPQPHQRIHTLITPLAAPAVGPHLLLARESALDAPDRIQALHVYSLLPDPAGAAVTLRLYAVTDPALLAAAQADPSKPVAVAPAQIRLLAGCDVTWRRDGDAFSGDMVPGACKATWPKTGGQATVTNAYRLTAGELWFSERLTDEAGTLLFGRADGVPYKLMRARPFSCYAAMLKEGTTDKYDGMLDVAMHDQGKLVTFRTEDGKETKYSFELSQLRYSQKVPVMKLALYEAGKEQAFTYSWAETTSRKIGINLRWIQVGCSAR